MHAEVLKRINWNEHKLMELTFKQKRWLEQRIPCPCCSMYNLLGIIGFKNLSGFILSWAGCLGECSRWGLAQQVRPLWLITTYGIFYVMSVTTEYKTALMCGSETFARKLIENNQLPAILWRSYYERYYLNVRTLKYDTEVELLNLKQLRIRREQASSSLAETEGEKGAHRQTREALDLSEKTVSWLFATVYCAQENYPFYGTQSEQFERSCALSLLNWRRCNLFHKNKIQLHSFGPYDEKVKKSSKNAFMSVLFCTTDLLILTYFW